MNGGNTERDERQGRHTGDGGLKPDDAARIAEDAATEAGEEALEFYRMDMEVGTKNGKTDYVTEADRRAQDAAVSAISDARPDDDVVGEEGEILKDVPDEGCCWIIDPIDGTSNFVRGMPIWTSSVAFVVDGDPVASANYVPAVDDLYVADTKVRLNGDEVAVSDASDRDVFNVVPTVWWDYDRRDEYAEVTDRILHGFGDMLRVGSVQAVLSMVASGSIDAAVTNVDVNPWDSVAGVHMVRCAGGTVTDRRGERWETDSVGLVASNGERHEAVVKTVRSVRDDTER